MATIDQVVGGLLILKKYVKAGAYCISAEHDEIYAGPGEEIVEGTEEEEEMLGTVVSPDDAAALRALGWFIDSEAQRWARFT